MQEAKLAPGRTLERVLQSMPQGQHKAFLAALEQRYRRESYLEGLREIKAWRALQPPTPPPDTPPLEPPPEAA